MCPEPIFGNQNFHSRERKCRETFVPENENVNMEELNRSQLGLRIFAVELLKPLPRTKTRTHT